MKLLINLKILVLAVFVITAIESHADDELQIESIQLKGMDISAQKFMKLDYSQPRRRPCDMIKVIFSGSGATFDGNNVLKDETENPHPGEYWVYHVHGKKIKIKMYCVGYEPLVISFDKSEVVPNESEPLVIDTDENNGGPDVYEVKISIKNLLPVEFNTFPLDVRLTVNQKEYEVKGGKCNLSLSPGNYTFVVEKDGYHSQSGELEVSENNVNHIDVDLGNQTVNLTTDEISYGRLSINNNIYEGYYVLKSELPHGKGTYKWANGNKYEGYFVEGKRTGRGTMTWANGDSYDGDWAADRMTGKGKYIWSDGDQYEGDFRNDLADGKGIYIWSSGNRYEGDFVNDRRTGKGVYIWENGDIYDGYFDNGKKTGKGTMTWSNGDMYIGDFANDRRTGKGTMTWASGDKYEGDFVNNKRNGKGTMTWANGDRFEGDFVYGNMSTGILYRANGEIENVGY